MTAYLETIICHVIAEVTRDVVEHERAVVRLTTSRSQQIYNEALPNWWNVSTSSSPGGQRWEQELGEHFEFLLGVWRIAE